MIDLLNHADEAGVAPDKIAHALERALDLGKFDRVHLGAMAERYGTSETRSIVKSALVAATCL